LLLIRKFIRIFSVGLNGKMPILLPIILIGFPALVHSFLSMGLDGRFKL
jgi:hypothetical protein